MSSRSTPSVAHVLLGDPGDGVRIYAERMASQCRLPDLVLTPESLWPSDLRVDVIDIHVNDRLVADDRLRWTDVLDHVARTGTPLVVTLHDVPQAAEGDDRFRRRCAAIRRIADAADLVCVSSVHEQRCAAELGISTTVVPHPIFGRHASDPVSRSNALTIAGFVHPGKGIVQLLDRLGPVRGTVLDGWSVRLVGAVAPSHRDHLTEIVETGRRSGLPVVHTGSVADAEWQTELATAGIAVCPHLHVSASGSLLSWIAAGRRPLTSDTEFARELSAEAPDALRIVRDGDWMSAIVDALAAPDAPTDIEGWRTPRRSGDIIEDVFRVAVRRRGERLAS